MRARQRWAQLLYRNSTSETPLQRRTRALWRTYSPHPRGQSRCESMRGRNRWRLATCWTRRLKQSKEIQVSRQRRRLNLQWSTIGATATNKKWTQKRKTKSPLPGGPRAPQTGKRFPRRRRKSRRAAQAIGAWADSNRLPPANRETRDGSRRKKKSQHRWRLRR